MSANNQTLIREHNGKWYVFPNTNAESWGNFNEETGEWKEENILDLSKEHYRAFDTYQEAEEYAQSEEHEDPTEYGIVNEVLFKDSAPVKII